MPNPTAFDWREDNEAAHVARHGVPFGIASGVFADTQRVEIPDLRPNTYGERRWNTVGVVDGIHLNVIFAMEGDTAKIISAHAAHRKEKKGLRCPVSRS